LDYLQSEMYACPALYNITTIYARKAILTP
jgi:hypothetical protein